MVVAVTVAVEFDNATEDCEPDVKDGVKRMNWVAVLLIVTPVCAAGVSACTNPLTLNPDPTRPLTVT